MRSRLRIRTAISGAAAVLAVLAAACTEPKPVAPRAAAPPVSLAPDLVEQASAYRAYVQRAGSINPAFANGGDIARSLKTGAAYEPKQFLRGAIAYGAVAALQDRTFVAAVRNYAADPKARQDLTAQIMHNPNTVLSLPGADGAAALVVGALGGEGEHLYTVGKAVKQAAYDVQRQNWSKAEVVNRTGRLAEAKALSAAPLAGDMAETGRLQKAVLGAESLGLSGRAKAPPQSTIVVRAMAVAALAALGEAGDGNVDRISALMVDPTASSCFNMSKLNLYQCLAVSKPHYEDVFCLGQHALMDTGQCLIRGAGLPPPEVYKPVKVAGAAQEKPAANAKNAAKKR